MNAPRETHVAPPGLMLWIGSNAPGACVPYLLSLLAYPLPRPGMLERREVNHFLAPEGLRTHDSAARVSPCQQAQQVQLLATWEGAAVSRSLDEKGANLL